MAIIYVCDECGAEVTQDAKYCSSCGAKISTEPKGVTKKTKSQERDKIDLNVDPDAISALYQGSLSIGIGVLFLCSFGLIIGCVILYRRSKIKKYWQSLLQSSRKDERNTLVSKIVGEARAMDWSGCIALTMSIIFVLFSLSSDSPTLILMNFCLRGIGIWCAYMLIRKVADVTKSERSGNTYSIDYERAKSLL